MGGQRAGRLRLLAGGRRGHGRGRGRHDTLHRRDLGRQGRGGAIGFSAAKFAARGMAENMARELGPEGIHVAHAIVGVAVSPPRRY